MKIQKSFYMLERKGKERSITLYNEMDDAIKKISEYLKGGATADQIELSEINVEEEEMKVTVVPWSKIAEKLVKQLK